MSAFAGLYVGAGGAQAGGGAIVRRAATLLLAAFLLLFHLYAGAFGPPTNLVFLSVHLCTALALLVLLRPLGPGVACRLVDAALFAGIVFVLSYLLAVRDTWQTRLVEMDALDHAAAVVLAVVVAEAVRRTVGWALVIVAALFVVHALFADRFPGVLYGAPVSPTSLLQTLFFGDAGIFGIPVLVMAQYVVLFLLFGRLLQATGAGDFFNRLAFAIFGHRVGGPAKAAVVSSGLFGTLSGSGVSNVLTTGAFTIPMMRRLGYRASFAGGVESAAAVGGAIMPPVMGAVAFMMAEFMGVSYAAIVAAAILPALLYYFAIYCTVHLEARRLGLATLDRRLLPRVAPLLRSHGYLLAPLVLIVVLLVVGYSIVLVAMITSLATILVSFTRPSTRLSPSRLVDAITDTAHATTSLSATCACAGIIIGAIFATGLSFQVTQAVMGLAANQLWLLVVLSALIALVLGTGLTASAVYITMVATVIPILKAAGVSDMGAHMFAFYYGVVSDITPPTALAAVAAAGIARANPMATMLAASRIGIAAFLVPITFVYSPALLLQGDWTTIVAATLTAGLGLFAIAAALAGFVTCELPTWARVTCLVAGALLVFSGGIGDLVGILALGVVMMVDRRRRLAAPVAHPAKARKPDAGAAPDADFDARLAFEVPADAAGPRDFGCWPAWLIIGLVVVAMAIMGRTHLHAHAPLAWLASLAGLAIVLVGGLRAVIATTLLDAPREPTGVPAME